MAFVTLILPALDEELALGPLLAEVDRALVSAIVVGDNGSRDGTARVATEHGALVVHVAERGYGAACAGALAAMPAQTEIVVFMDADGSDDPAEMQLLLAPILGGSADLVIGSRQFVASGALSPQQRFGNWLATELIARIYGHRYSDLGPFRAVRRKTLETIAMRDRRYGWTVEMQVRALQIGARVTEVPVHYRRRTGRSKISGTVTGVLKAGWWILYTIARLAFRRS